MTEHLPFITFTRVNGESIFQSPFMACAGFLLQPFCHPSAGSRGFFEALFRHLALILLPVCPTEEGLGLPRRVPRLLSCFRFETLHVFNLFSHSAFDLVSGDYTVHLPREGTVTSPLPPQLLVWCQAADGCSVDGKERKASMPDGDSAPYAISTELIWGSCSCYF